MIFVRRPPLPVGTLWLIPNNKHFTCFCFTYYCSAPQLYYQFAYYKGRRTVAYFFLLNWIFQVLANALKPKIFQKNLGLLFDNKEINCLKTFLIVFLNKYVSRKDIFH